MSRRGVQTPARTRADRALTTSLWWTLPFLGSIILVSVGIRVATDWPHILDGTLPDEDSYEIRYVLHPALAYIHIGFGAVYLLCAPLQLSRRFRTTHYTAHRRIGRVALTGGCIAGIFGIIAGTLFPFGGLLEASATVLFGQYYVIALATAFLAIRRGDVTTHRRWMIRALAIGLAVSTIRIWIGLLTLAQLMTFEDRFGAAFWLSFPLHAVAAEVYLRHRPVANAIPMEDEPT